MRNSSEGDRNKEKRNLFPLFWVEQKVTWVKYNLMKLFVPSRECRHLYTGQDIQRELTLLTDLSKKNTFLHFRKMEATISYQNTWQVIFL